MSPVKENILKTWCQILCNFYGQNLRKFKMFFGQSGQSEKSPMFHWPLMGNVKLTFVHFSAALHSVWVYEAVRNVAQKMAERQWKLMDFWSKLSYYLIITDSWGGEIDSKATKIQKSNILITLRRPLVRISLFKLLKCLNLLILKVWSLLAC